MKVLLINGSPDGKGCIHTALTLAAEVLNREGIETEEIHVGNKDIRGCIACRRCKQTGKCVFSDLVNEVSPKLAEADGIVIDPSIPSEWKSYTMRKVFRGKVLNVTVNNPNGSEHGVKSVTVNGAKIDGLLIRDDILQAENEIVIEM